MRPVYTGIAALIAVSGFNSSGFADAPKAQKVEIVAHRGASHQAPENTLSSVQLGWEEGADAVEVDVYLTADNGIVCFHDDKLKRTTGAEGLIWDKTLAELAELEAGAWKNAEYRGEPIPEISSVIETIPDGKRLFIEIKCGTEIIPFLVPMIQESGKTTEQIAIISFQYDVCVEMKKKLPAHQVYFLSGFKKQEDGSQKPTIQELIVKAKDGGLDGLDLSRKGPLDSTNVKAIHDAGLFLAVYTVDDPATAAHLVRAGVDSITTNTPEALRTALETTTP